MTRRRSNGPTVTSSAHGATPTRTASAASLEAQRRPPRPVPSASAAPPVRVCGQRSRADATRRRRRPVCIGHVCPTMKEIDITVALTTPSTRPGHHSCDDWSRGDHCRSDAYAAEAPSWYRSSNEEGPRWVCGRGRRGRFVSLRSERRSCRGDRRTPAHRGRQARQRPNLPAERRRPSAAERWFDLDAWQWYLARVMRFEGIAVGPLGQEH